MSCDGGERRFGSRLSCGLTISPGVFLMYSLLCALLTRWSQVQFYCGKLTLHAFFDSPRFPSRFGSTPNYPRLCVPPPAPPARTRGCVCLCLGLVGRGVPAEGFDPVPSLSRRRRVTPRYRPGGGTSLILSFGLTWTDPWLWGFPLN